MGDSNSLYPMKTTTSLEELGYQIAKWDALNVSIYVIYYSRYCKRHIIYNPSHKKTHIMVAKIETIKLLYWDRR